MSSGAGPAEQGNVQGALHGAQSLSQAAGLLIFPKIYRASGVAAFIVGGFVNAAAAVLVAVLWWRVGRDGSRSGLGGGGGGGFGSSRRNSEEALLPIVSAAIADEDDDGDEKRL